MEEELKYARMLIVINPEAPSTLDLINVPYEVAQHFIRATESDDPAQICVMEYETSAGTKRFSTRAGSVVAIDVMFTVDPIVREDAHPEPDFVGVADDPNEDCAPEEDASPDPYVPGDEEGTFGVCETGSCEEQEADMTTPSVAVYPQ